MAPPSGYGCWSAEIRLCPQLDSFTLHAQYDDRLHHNLVDPVSWLSNATYLMDEAVTVEGIRFWGSPWQPWFFDWAFNLQRGAEIRAKWDLIPLQTDVLVTHGPPVGHGDLTSRGDAAGCEDLMEVVRHVRPRLHIFGHIHEGYGVTEEDGIAFFNASSCNLGDNPVNPPLVYHYET